MPRHTHFSLVSYHLSKWLVGSRTNHLNPTEITVLITVHRANVRVGSYLVCHRDRNPMPSPFFCMKPSITEVGFTMAVALAVAGDAIDSRDAELTVELPRLSDFLSLCATASISGKNIFRLIHYVD